MSDAAPVRLSTTYARTAFSKLKLCVSFRGNDSGLLSGGGRNTVGLAFFLSLGASRTKR